MVGSNKMNIVIFGTGRFYQNRKQEVWKEKVVAFLDNDVKKQGSMLDDRMVYSPDEVLKLHYDYILLMGKYDFVEEMRIQLNNIGVHINDVLNYEEFLDIRETQPMQFFYGKGNCDLFDKSQKKVLLLSHELSNTGAPLVLLNVALIMKENGYSPVIMSPRDGELKTAIIEKGIPVVVVSYINKKNTFVWQWMLSFDFIWVNTLSFGYLIDDLTDSNVPAAWWLHETDISYEILGMSRMPKKEKRIPVYGVGEKTIASYKKFMKRDDIRNLFYGIPELKPERKLTFALIGTISERKAQDIFVDAIAMLSEEQRSKACFKIIGSIIEQHVYDYVVENAKKMPCIEVLEPVEHEEMLQMYEKFDVVVCPSRMDPMPVVITEGLMNRKVCIASTQTGSAGLITDGVNGFVCEVNKESLMEKISWIIEHKDELDDIRENARKIYENNFSLEVFERNIMSII